MDEVPQIMGAGLVGRPFLSRDVELETDEYGNEIPVRAKSMPSNCIRVMHSPLAVDHGGGCNELCPGRQRDGTCLVDLVRAANAHGVDWLFEINHVGERLWWDYVGPQIPKENNGEIEA